MNKVLFATLALTCLAFASAQESFFQNDNVAAKNRAAVSKADRVQDREKARNSEDQRSKLAAQKGNGDKFAFKNSDDGEDFFRAKDMEEFNNDHAVAKSSKFALQVVDENDHKEKSNVNFRKGSAVDTGKKFSTDTALQQERFDKAELQTANDKSRDNEFARDLAAENLFDAKDEDFFESDNELGFESTFNDPRRGGGFGGERGGFGGQRGGFGGQFGGFGGQRGGLGGRRGGFGGQQGGFGGQHGGFGGQQGGFGGQHGGFGGQHGGFGGQHGGFGGQHGGFGGQHGGFDGGFFGSGNGHGSKFGKH